MRKRLFDTEEQQEVGLNLKLKVKPLMPDKNINAVY